MTNRLCECGDPHYAKGMCRIHYRRWRYAHFKPTRRTQRGETLHARFLERVDRRGDDECWLWTGTIQKGYGSITAGRGIKLAAHRLAYETWVAEIPEGMSIDHECHNRAFAAGLCRGGEGCLHRRCCNPTHLIPRDPTENWRRGAGLGARWRPT